MDPVLNAVKWSVIEWTGHSTKHLQTTDYPSHALFQEWEL